MADVVTLAEAVAEHERACNATGWELRTAADVATTEPPTDEELATLRQLTRETR